jgi:hypothetical protein
VPTVQTITYSPDEAGLARTTVGHAAEMANGGSAYVRTQGAGAVWRLLHAAATDDGGFFVRLEPVDPHDVPIGRGVYEMPLARGPAAGTLAL